MKWHKMKKCLPPEGEVALIRCNGRRTHYIIEEVQHECEGVS